MAEVEVAGDGTVTVDVGDEVVVRLPEGSDRTWTVHSMGERLLLVGDVVAPSSGPPAAGRTRVLRLRAVGPTGDEVVLHLLRPGEAEPAEQRRITVAVRR